MGPIHINWPWTTYSKQSPYVTFYCQNLIDTNFCNKLLLPMKSGYYVSTIRGSGNGPILKMCPNQKQKTICIEKKWYCQPGANFKGLSTSNFHLRNITVDAKLYRQQLEKLRAALQANRSERWKVWLLHDNARPDTAKTGKSRMGRLTPSTIFARFDSLRLSSISFAPQLSGYRTLRRASKTKSGPRQFLFVCPRSSLKMDLWICLKDGTIS